MEEAHEGGYLDVLCVGIINNLWSRRDRVKTYRTGQTSVFYEASDHLLRIGTSESMEAGIVSEDRLSHPTHKYDASIDHEYNIAQNIIETEKNNENESDRYKARIFYYSNSLYKNPRQFAKCVDIPYNAVLEAYNSFKEKLKHDIHLNRNSK